MFGIGADILIVGYNNNGADHDKTLCKAFQIFRKDNLKFNKDKCYLTCSSVSFLMKIFSGKA